MCPLQSRWIVGHLVNIPGAVWSQEAQEVQTGDIVLALAECAVRSGLQISGSAPGRID